MNPILYFESAVVEGTTLVKFPLPSFVIVNVSVLVEFLLTLPKKMDEVEELKLKLGVTFTFIVHKNLKILCCFKSVAATD